MPGSVPSKKRPKDVAGTGNGMDYIRRTRRRPLEHGEIEIATLPDIQNVLHPPTADYISTHVAPMPRGHINSIPEAEHDGWDVQLAEAIAAGDYFGSNVPPPTADVIPNRLPPSITDQYAEQRRNELADDDMAGWGMPDPVDDLSGWGIRGRGGRRKRSLRKPKSFRKKRSLRKTKSFRKKRSLRKKTSLRKTKSSIRK